MLKHNLPILSGARSHVEGRADPLLCRSPPEEMIGDWAKFVSDTTEEAERELLRRHQRTGRPLGGEGFIDEVERIVGRVLRPHKPGRPRTPGK